MQILHCSNKQPNDKLYFIEKEGALSFNEISYYLSYVENLSVVLYIMALRET